MLNKAKQNIALSLSIITLFLFPVLSVNAAKFFDDDLGGGNGALLQNKDTAIANAGFGGEIRANVFIGKLINGLAGVLGVLIFLIILYAGFLWLTAGGNEDQVTKAKTWLRNGLIGLFIVIAAYAIALLLTAALTQGANYGQVDAPNI